MVFPIYNLGIFHCHVGDSLSILKAELKSQKKQVKHLKKKSLWSRSLEEVTIEYCST